MLRAQMADPNTSPSAHIPSGDSSRLQRAADALDAAIAQLSLPAVRVLYSVVAVMTAGALGRGHAGLFGPRAAGAACRSVIGAKTVASLLSLAMTVVVESFRAHFAARFPFSRLWRALHVSQRRGSGDSPGSFVHESPMRTMLPRFGLFFPSAYRLSLPQGATLINCDTAERARVARKFDQCAKDGFDAVLKNSRVSHVSTCYDACVHA